MKTCFEYIGYIHSSHKPYGYQKEIVYYVIAKSRGQFKVERVSEYTDHRSSSWYTLKQLQAKIRRFDWVTEKGKKYLRRKK